MKIFEPYLRISGIFWKDYTDSWQNFANEFNEGKPNREHLKPAHMNLYYRLVLIANRTIEADNKRGNRGGLAIDSDAPYPIRTNTPYLMSILGYTSEKTISNHFNRLKKAGLLRKINHGPFRPLEVLISPKMLLIWDYSNENYRPNPYFFDAENQAFIKDERKNLPHVYVLQEHSNNIIRNVEKPQIKCGINRSQNNMESSDCRTIASLTGAFYRSTPKQKKSKIDLPTKSQNSPSDPTIQEPQKEKSSAKKEKVNKYSKEWNIDNFARQFYGLMISFIFKYHDIWPSEKEKTLEYLRTEYFANITSEKQAKNWMIEHAWRIEAATRFYKTHDYDTSNIYPWKYIQKNNKKGYPETKTWWLKNEADRIDRQKRKLNARKALTKQHNMQKILDAYYDNPTLSEYKKAETYVQHNLPDLLPQFYEAIQYKSAELANI